MILNNERSPNSLQDVYLCAMCTFLFLSCDIYIYRGYLSIERKTVNSIQRFHDLCRYALLYFSIRSLTRRCACFSFFSLSLSLHKSEPIRSLHIRVRHCRKYFPLSLFSIQTNYATIFFLLFVSRHIVNIIFVWFFFLSFSLQYVHALC